MNDLYREEILEHWQNPLNFGVMRGADLVVDQVNPLCGDELTLFFKINKGKIADISFIGNGCAISIASASILSDNVKGKSVRTVSKLIGDDVLEMLGGPVAPARLKCAFLALEALRKVTNMSELPAKQATNLNE
ncbi:MAG: iron-sulfur cluster assembly scaffold protein [Candidatus Curtissbacteria bacterium]|nr:iron-sulfur cluster assembly scaffold protein [Candidatus Curtissbacteria bacterium]